MMSSPLIRPDPPALVLDTNVVLDWLLFRNPACAAIEACVLAGGVRWVATQAMRYELAHVLARGDLNAWKPDLPTLWSHWSRNCNELPEPAPRSPNARLHCADPHDQKFIDLAVACGARWLVSRDRAVLKLARAMREVGTEVIAPDAWAERNGAAEAAPI